MKTYYIGLICASHAQAFLNVKLNLKVCPLTDVTNAFSCQAPAFCARPSSAALATETTRLHVS